MKVTLLTYTPNPEQVVATAAKLCYSNVSATDVYDKNRDQDASCFIKYLSELGHESPLEHISFTFAIEGVSRSLLAQITRHRIASFSVKSQRYVEEVEPKYITPPAISVDGEANKVYENTIQTIWNAYSELSHILKNKYCESGMDDKSAQKKAIEDARYILPNACETQMIVTMNARSLLNFFKLRCCNRAQWEIRDLADTMLCLVKEVCPSVFKNAGASCMSDKCSEGKMTCGHPRKIEKK